MEIPVHKCETKTKKTHMHDTVNNLAQHCEVYFSAQGSVLLNIEVSLVARYTAPLGYPSSTVYSYLYEAVLSSNGLYLSSAKQENIIQRSSVTGQ